MSVIAVKFLDNIPNTLAAKPGVMHQLQGVAAEMGKSAWNVLAVASEYQAKASDPRLGVSRGPNVNANLLKANAAKRASSSISVGQSIIMERAAKKMDLKMKSNVRIDVYLFQLPRKVKGKQGSMTEVRLFLLLQYIPSVKLISTNRSQKFVHRKCLTCRVLLQQPGNSSW